MSDKAFKREMSNNVRALQEGYEQLYYKIEALYVYFDLVHIKANGPNIYTEARAVPRKSLQEPLTEE